jgi:hypothetical protein
MHCQKSASWAKEVLNQIRRNFHYRDRHTFSRLYKQYVRPRLEFASPAYNPWRHSDMDVLEKVQEKEKAVKMGLQVKWHQVRCEELKLEALEMRRTDQDLALTHKMLVKH